MSNKNNENGFIDGNRGKQDNDPDINKEMKAISRLSAIVILALFAFITLYNSFYTLNSQEYGLLITFGAAQEVNTPGVHTKIPYFQKVQKVSKEIMGMPIGYNGDESITKESMMITRDFNIINVDFYIEYRVTDPVKAWYKSDSVDSVLKNLAQSYIRDTVGLYKIDEVLTSEKNKIQAEVKEKLINRLEQEDLGILVSNVTIQDSELPTDEVSTAFKDVENAKQDMDTLLNKAAKYENEQIPAARAEADKVTKEADAFREERINEAKGQVARFNEMYDEYVKFPQLTEKRMFYETIESLLPGKKIIIDNGDGTQKLLPLESLVTSSSTKTQE